MTADSEGTAFKITNYKSPAVWGYLVWGQIEPRGQTASQETNLLLEFKFPVKTQKIELCSVYSTGMPRGRGSEKDLSQLGGIFFPVIQFRTAYVW